MDGIILIDKPKGWTSFDVVNYIRKMVANYVGKKPRNTKVGHTGTLDPAATGLLVICIGTYTKKVNELIRQDKVYETEITLGAVSTTGDAEGVISKKQNIDSTKGEQLKRVEVESVLEGFIGEQEQVPPAYSAIKVNGKRAYELARAGKEVKLEPRQVNIHSIDLESYEWPKLRITTKVSSGTYIRVLGEDIGSKLRVGGYLTELRRTAIGDFDIKDALQIEGLTIEQIQRSLFN